VLQIGKMLPEDEFKTRVVPILSSLFSSADPTIRSTLLDAVPQFAQFLTETVVENTIYPQVRGACTLGARMNGACMQVACRVGARTNGACTCRALTA
jgi:hypothetical protein